MFVKLDCLLMGLGLDVWGLVRPHMGAWQAEHLVRDPEMILDQEGESEELTAPQPWLQASILSLTQEHEIYSRV